MKLKYYISEIRNLLPMDNNNIDDRMLIELLNQFRANYIKNEFNRNRIIPLEITQTISGISMNLARQLDVPFIKDSSRILKSDIQIPNVIHTGQEYLVERVFDGRILSKNYNHILAKDAIYAGNGKTNSKSVFSFIYNGYLYLKLKQQNPNINLITNVTLQAVFENPLNLIQLEYKDYFDSLNYEYPLTKAMWGQIKSNLLRDGLQIVQNEINEGKES